jgi:hypothetical protein
MLCFRKSKKKKYLTWDEGLNIWNQNIYVCFLLRSEMPNRIRSWEKTNQSERDRLLCVFYIFVFVFRAIKCRRVENNYCHLEYCPTSHGPAIQIETIIHANESQCGTETVLLHVAVIIINKIMNSRTVGETKVNWLSHISPTGECSQSSDYWFWKWEQSFSWWVIDPFLMLTRKKQELRNLLNTGTR